MDNSNKAYESVLNNKIAKLNKQINILGREIQNSKNVLGRQERKLIALKKELQKIEQEKRDYEIANSNKYKEAFSVKKLDSRYEKNVEKVEAIEGQIKSLKELKEKLKTNRARNSVDNKIARRQEKLKRLKKGKTLISGAQKSIIVSKRGLLNLRNKILSRQESNVDYYTDRLSDTRDIKESLDLNAKGLTGIKNKVLNTAYGIKEGHYMRKKEKHEAILKEMHNHKVGFVGARTIVMSKRIANGLKDALDVNMFTAPVDSVARTI